MMLPVTYVLVGLSSKHALLIHMKVGCMIPFFALALDRNVDTDSAE